MLLLLYSMLFYYMLNAQLFPLSQRPDQKELQSVFADSVIFLLKSLWYAFSSSLFYCAPYLLIAMSVFRVHSDTFFRFLFSECLHRICLPRQAACDCAGRSVPQLGFVASHQSAMSTPSVLLCQCPFNDSSWRKRGGQCAVNTSQIDLSSRLQYDRIFAPCLVFRVMKKSAICFAIAGGGLFCFTAQCLDLNFTSFVARNTVKISGNFTNQQSSNTKILHSAHTEYLCVV